ncbi:MAG: 30S ribosomal protein S6 [Tepidisphaeraceae bacterium]
MAKKTQKKAAAPVVARESTYEAMFLFPPPGTTDLDGMIKLAQGFIERHGGKVLLIKKWDERKLYYEIKKQKRGMYIIAYFTAAGTAVGQIERDVMLSEDVLRVLITTADHLKQKEMEAVEPQPIQPREERAPWDRPDFNRPPRRDDRGPSDRAPSDRPRRDEGAAVEAGAGMDKD